MPKFWEKDTNPWQGDDPWFVMRMPIMGLFLSVSIGEGGAYLGFKTFRVEDQHRSLGRYGNWTREDEFPEPNGVNVFLQSSATILRSTPNLPFDRRQFSAPAE